MNKTASTASIMYNKPRNLYYCGVKPEVPTLPNGSVGSFDLLPANTTVNQTCWPGFKDAISPVPENNVLTAINQVKDTNKILEDTSDKENVNTLEDKQKETKEIINEALNSNNDMSMDNKIALAILLLTFGGVVIIKSISNMKVI